MCCYRFSIILMLLCSQPLFAQPLTRTDIRESTGHIESARQLESASPTSAPTRAAGAEAGSSTVREATAVTASSPRLPTSLIPGTSPPSSVPDKPVESATTAQKDNVTRAEIMPGNTPDPVEAILPKGSKLQRGGSLLGQSLPAVPTLTTSKKALAPLHQILISAPSQQIAEQQRVQLSRYQLRISSRKNLSALGLVLSTFRVPEAVDIDALVEEISAVFPESTIEKNQRYRLLSKKRAYGHSLVGLSVPSQCRKPLQIAMLDSAINTQLAIFSGQRVTLLDVTGASDLPNNHGSAIASLLISDQDEFPGILPEANLQVVNVFAFDRGGEPETRTDWLLMGLNILAGLTPSPQAVNLSFGGKHSVLIDIATKKLSEKMVFVAAAGNDGSDRLIYPAAYRHVYAVGAVNARGEKMPQSNYGRHVKLLAPGEDIWTRNGKGKGLYVSGTSLSTPFATAALAILKSEGRSITDYLISLGDRPLLDFSSVCQR